MVLATMAGVGPESTVEILSNSAILSGLSSLKAPYVLRQSRLRHHFFRKMVPRGSRAHFGLRKKRTARPFL